VVVCVAYYNGGGCWLVLVMKRGLVLRGRWIVGWLIRGMKKEKPKSLPVFSPTAHCSSSSHPGQTNDRHLHFLRRVLKKQEADDD